MSAEAPGSSSGPRLVHNICFIGAGFVGAASAAVLAWFCIDAQVTVIDKNERRIAAWNSKHLPIYEPELKSYVRATRDGTCDGSCGYKCRESSEDAHKSIHAANLSFTTSTEALKTADIVFVAVDTSFQDTGDSTTLLDMSNFTGAMKDIANDAQPGTIVVEKSTMPCYPSNELYRKYGAETLKKLQEKDVEILYIPEFLAEGTALRNLFSPDRVVIGCEATLRGMQAARTLGDIYAQWVHSERILIMELRDAQMSKIAANALLASKISAINSISVLCERMGADIDVVGSGIGMDPRIGTGYLQAGLGFGGACLPKDLLTLAEMARHQHLPSIAKYWSNQYDMTAVQITEHISRLGAALGNDLDGKRITILGYAHKTGTSDVRGSLASRLIRAILKAWAVNLDPTSMAKYKLDHRVSNVVVHDKWMEYDEVMTGTEAGPAEMQLRRITGPHGVHLAIFDPFCWPNDIKNNLEASLVAPEPTANDITIYRDVHRACSKSDAIIVLTSYWSASGPSLAPETMRRFISAKKEKQRLKRQRARPLVTVDETADFMKISKNNNESTLNRKRSSGNSGQFRVGTESPKKQRQEGNVMITATSPDSEQMASRQIIGDSDSDIRTLAIHHANAHRGPVAAKKANHTKQCSGDSDAEPSSPKRKASPDPEEGYPTLSETYGTLNHGYVGTRGTSKSFDEVHFSELLKQGVCPDDCEGCRNDAQRFESYLDWSLVATRMRGAKLVYDVPRVLDEEKMKLLGFRVETLGRKYDRYEQQSFRDISFSDIGGKDNSVAVDDHKASDSLRELPHVSSPSKADAEATGEAASCKNRATCSVPAIPNPDLWY